MSHSRAHSHVPTSNGQVHHDSAPSPPPPPPSTQQPGVPGAAQPRQAMPPSDTSESLRASQSIQNSQHAHQPNVVPPLTYKSLRPLKTTTTNAEPMLLRRAVPPEQRALPVAQEQRTIIVTKQLPSSRAAGTYDNLVPGYMSNREDEEAEKRPTTPVCSVTASAKAPPMQNAAYYGIREVKTSAARVREIPITTLATKDGQAPLQEPMQLKVSSTEVTHAPKHTTTPSHGSTKEIIEATIQEPPVPRTYGATAPLKGQVITKGAPVVKPQVPQKPKNLAGIMSASHRPPTPPKSQQSPEETKQQPLQVPDIDIANGESTSTSPEVQHKLLLSGECPYVLHMRHVKTPDGAQTLPHNLSTFTDSPQRGRAKQRAPPDTEFRVYRRKSLDLVPRRRLPGPDSFSSQDHSVSPTTPDAGNILDYVLRKRTQSQDRMQVLASGAKSKRDDPRRRTQPIPVAVSGAVRRLQDYDTIGLSLPNRPPKASSQPELPYDDDDLADEGEYGSSIDSRSLHEGMDALEGVVDALVIDYGNDEAIDDRNSLPPPPPALMNR